MGVTNDQLESVRTAVQSLPYAECRRSTGGNGLHIYVCFEDHEDFTTANHTEHAALARCVLGVMSRDSGFDFQSTIDGCGGNMWLWHRKQKYSLGEGLKLINAASEVFPHEKLPAWRDHIEVVSRRRTKVKLDGVANADEDVFDQLAMAHRKVDLDDKHKAIMDEIAKRGYSCVWSSDHHLLQTHTKGFAEIMGEMKDEFQLQGVFLTNSRGADPKTPNCFGFPIDRGGFKLIRFSPGCSESPTWAQDGRGWTTCWFNVTPSLDVAAHSLGGKPLKRGGYEFATLEDAIKVAHILSPGIDLVGLPAMTN